MRRAVLEFRRFGAEPSNMAEVEHGGCHDLSERVGWGICLHSEKGPEMLAGRFISSGMGRRQ